MLVFRKILRTYVLNRWYLNLFTETLDDFKKTLNKWFYCQPWKKDQHLRKHFMVSFIKIFPLIWKVCFFVDLFRLTFAHFSKNIWLQRYWWVICKLVWLKIKIRKKGSPVLTRERTFHFDTLSSAETTFLSSKKLQSWSW